MDPRLYYYVHLSIFSTTYFLFLNQLAAYSLFHVHHHPGIPINVTKHFYFSNFTSNSNLNTIHQVKLLGNALISQDEGIIQIPDPSPAVDHINQAGRAIYSSPIRLFDPITVTPGSFQTTFSFQFTTTDKSFPHIVSGGSGLAFVIVPDEFTVGRPGPWLGILNDACEHYKAFAVEFDNSYDPKFGDPNDDHVGVNLGSVVSFKTTNSSETNASLHVSSIHRAWIKYDGHRKWIDIYLALDGNPVPSQPVLSTPLNLSPFLKEYMFVGFSASTGESPQVHNILSWEFSSTVRGLINVPLKRTCHRNVAHQVSKYSTLNHKHKASNFMILMCVFGLCTLISLNLYCFRKRNTQSSRAFVFPVKKQRPLPPSQPRRFVILELYMATKRFSKIEVLASDLRGVLYRGTLANGCYVAVKRFTSESLTLSRLDRTRVLQRISSITHVRHLSLAPIRGWCFDNRETILVYEYYQNGSLDRWLFGVGALPWSRRFSLIKDIADALTFLHSKELTHGNLHSSSVFLDINYTAVLGDYGFVFYKESSGRKDFVSRKSTDVMCFGMLVLEIVAGKRTTEIEEEQIGVFEFAWSMHGRGEKEKVIDERMGWIAVNLDEIVRVLDIGLWCTLDENNGRPTVEQVVQFLNNQKPIPKLPSSPRTQLSSRSSSSVSV